MYTFKKENDELVQYVDTSNVVTTAPQSFTSIEQEQARTNISAAKASDVEANSTTLDAMVEEVVDDIPVVKIAKYASTDTTKGTIEERLTNLAYREGVVSDINSDVNTVITNYIKREGNYVIGELCLTSYELSNYLLGKVQSNFLPKQKVITYCMGYGIHMGFDNPSSLLIRIEIETNGDIYAYNNTCVGWFEFTTNSHITFGYEASPLS